MDEDADYYTWRLDQTLAKNVTRLVDYNERVEQGEGDPLEDRIERARDGQSTVLTNGEIGDWFWWRTTRHAREGIELLLLRAEGRAVLGKLRELVTQMEEDDAFRAVCFGDGRGDGAALEDGEAEVQDRDYHPGDLVRLNYDDASRDDDDGARHRELGELRRQYDELVRQDEEDELRLDNAMHLRSGRRPRSRS